MTIDNIIKTQRLPKNFLKVDKRLNLYKVKLDNDTYFVELITKNSKNIDIEPVSIHSYLIDIVIGYHMEITLKV